MKMLKKSKKKLSKAWETVKESCQAQWFYTKEYKTEIVTAVKTMILIVLVFIASMGANEVHESWLESSVGTNSVFIRSPDGAKIMGSATGFEVVAPSGHVYTLTNQHVCELQKDGYLMVGEKNHSGRLIPRRVLEVYEDNDLCLVEGLPGYTGLKLADEIHTGESVWSLGYPLGEGLNVSRGRVKGFQPITIVLQEVPAEECTQPNEHVINVKVFFFDLQVCAIDRNSVATDVPTYPGNSGSPLVNFWGNVVGVVFASNSDTHWGFAVPLSDVQKFLSAY